MACFKRLRLFSNEIPLWIRYCYVACDTQPSYPNANSGCSTFTFSLAPAPLPQHLCIWSPDSRPCLSMPGLNLPGPSRLMRIEALRQHSRRARSSGHHSHRWRTLIRVESLRRVTRSDHSRRLVRSDGWRRRFVLLCRYLRTWVNSRIDWTLVKPFGVVVVVCDFRVVVCILHERQVFRFEWFPCCELTCPRYTTIPPELPCKVSKSTGAP